MEAVALIEKMKADFAIPLRETVSVAGFSYPSFMRWRQRIAAGDPPVGTPGPKKIAPLDLGELTRKIKSLDHGKKRSRGSGSLRASYKNAISRRELEAMIASVRNAENRKRAAGRCRVIWHRADLAWALDGCEYGGHPGVVTMHVQNLQDLCSQYKFSPLATGSKPCGEEVAGHLDRQFGRYGPPLFIKRDNGGNLNHVSINKLLEDALVIPINSPVKNPPYNGAIEHSQGEIKSFLDTWQDKARSIEELLLLADGAAHDLNHKPRRSLGGRTACRCYFGENRIRYSKRERKGVYCWIQDLAVDLSQADGKDVITPTAWRMAAKKWLIDNKLITIVGQRKVLPYLSPGFYHN
jgi:hypothetical protein